MAEPSRIARTPTPAIIITQLITGAVFLVLAFLNAVSVSGDWEAILAVALGAVGGALVGQGLTMERHRRAAREQD